MDKITVKIVKNAERQAQDVISGELDYMQDPPPADIKPEVKSKYSDRYREITTASTFYMFMNGRTPPFDKKEVREAVNIGLDKPALARLFGGDIAPGCSFLPPGQPGYDKALDTTDCPWGDPEQAARPREGPSDDQGRGRRRDGRDRLRQQRRPDRQGHGGLRRPVEQDGA